MEVLSAIWQTELKEAKVITLQKKGQVLSPPIFQFDGTLELVTDISAK